MRAEDLEPLEDRAIIRPEAAPEKIGSLHVPAGAQEQPTRGQVIAVGPGRQNDQGERIPLALKPGDTVIYGKYSGTPYEFGAEKLIIIKAVDVLARIRPA